jgi:transcriptional regulator with XRE-family HTH domain
MIAGPRGVGMKLGDVIKKEREGKTGLNRYHQLTVEEVAGKLGVAPAEWQIFESGDSPVEKWFPTLCQIAVTLKVPTSRLLAKSGKSKDTKPGQAAHLIREHREERGKTVEEMAALLEMSVDDYLPIEKGTSPIEKVGPLMLGFAELIEQPVFNLYLPCGVLYSKLEDYP